MRKYLVPGALLALLAAFTAFTQVPIDGIIALSSSSVFDFSNALRTRTKTGTVEPAVCGIGDQFTKTDAPANEQFRVAISTGPCVWAIQSGPASTVYNNQANTYTAGSKQTFQASATTAGRRLVCAPLPSTPTAGDEACDSGDSNKHKIYNGTAWVASGDGVGGGGGPATVVCIGGLVGDGSAATPCRLSTVSNRTISGTGSLTITFNELDGGCELYSIPVATAAAGDRSAADFVMPVEVVGVTVQGTHVRPGFVDVEMCNKSGSPVNQSGINLSAWTWGPL